MNRVRVFVGVVSELILGPVGTGVRQTGTVRYRSWSSSHSSEGARDPTPGATSTAGTDQHQSVAARQKLWAQTFSTYTPFPQDLLALSEIAGHRSPSLFLETFEVPDHARAPWKSGPLRLNRATPGEPDRPRALGHHHHRLTPAPSRHRDGLAAAKPTAAFRPRRCGVISASFVRRVGRAGGGPTRCSHHPPERQVPANHYLPRLRRDSHGATRR